MDVTTKRIYSPVSPDDGYRVLVDRLWPRGVSKAAASLDLWLRDVAPSTELRTWWDHDPGKQEEFAARYDAELDHNPAVDELRQAVQDHPRVTLLYAARDPHMNHAQVLLDYLTGEA